MEIPDNRPREPGSGVEVKMPESIADNHRLLSHFSRQLR
jgi:hypothetical protein